MRKRCLGPSRSRRTATLYPGSHSQCENEHGESKRPTTTYSPPSSFGPTRQFTEITQAPLPPIYRKFLSIIGIVTFDVGHIFSAGCINTKIDFYDKLRYVKQTQTDPCSKVESRGYAEASTYRPAESIENMIQGAF